MASVGRNDPCPCGSGEKYKRCCLESGGVRDMRKLRISLWLAAGVVVLAALGGLFGGRDVAALIAVAGTVGIGGYLIFADPPPPTSGGSPGAINFGR